MPRVPSSSQSGSLVTVRTDDPVIDALALVHRSLTNGDFIAAIRALDSTARANTIDLIDTLADRLAMTRQTLTALPIGATP